MWLRNIFLKALFLMVVLSLTVLSISSFFVTDVESHVFETSVESNQESWIPTLIPRSTCVPSKVGKEIGCPEPPSTPCVLFQVGKEIGCVPVLPKCTPSPNGNEIGCIQPVPTCTPLKVGDQIGCQNIAKGCLYLLSETDEDCSPRFDPAEIDWRCKAKFGCRYVPTPELITWEEVCFERNCELNP